MYLNKHGINSVELNTGDLGIVLESPFENGQLITESFGAWLSATGTLNRLRSIHLITAQKPTVKELRQGWERVKVECAGNMLSRVLVMGTTDLLKVMIPKADLNLFDAHGTLFTIDGIEYVPTWREIKPHYTPWFERDVDRFLSLRKPEMSLLYNSELPKRRPDHVIVDLETTGLDPYYDTITCVGVQWDDNERALAYYENRYEFLDTLISWAKQGTHFTFHNAQFDLGFMPDEFRQAAYGQVHCTLIRSKTRGELINGLKHLGNLYTNRPGNYAWHVEGEHDFNDPKYVCEDLEVTWQLAKKWL